MIRVDYWYADSKGGLNMRNRTSVFKWDFDSLKKYRNYDKIDFKSCHGIAVDLDEDVIFQICGYSHDRGLYCDLFD